MRRWNQNIKYSYQKFINDSTILQTQKLDVLFGF